MSLHVERRRDGGLALYIDGDLQLDTADEAVYHESLVLPALSLLRVRRGESATGIRVLICGGGDGLALREVLRFPGVTHVDLVDYDPDVVALGCTDLAPFNLGAFSDARVTIHIADAWQFTESCDLYDVIVCDLTVPRRPEETRVFTREWYTRLSSVLSPDGLLAINGFSPRKTPEAFWCLHRTVRAAGLSALPYRVCIPSFRAHGYGAWAFLLAGRQSIRQTDLRNLRCPVTTAQADLGRLWRGARFSRGERRLATTAPVNTLGYSILLPMLLNPGARSLDASAATIYDVDALLGAVPILHPYHTREMVEALAEQVAGAVRAIDVRKLVQALLRRAADLPRELFAELLRLRDYLRDHSPDFSHMQSWGYRLFAALVIVMTVANAIAPDNAFGKGGSGIGHASFSRGFSASPSGVRGGFGGGRGGGESFGSSHVSGSTPHVSGSAFRSGYGHGYASDIYGYQYRPRVFIFSSSRHYYGGRGGGHSSSSGTREEHKTLFVADDDLLVLDNGDVVITLSDTAYMLANEGRLDLYSVNSLDPLLPLYPEPALFQTVSQEIHQQQTAVRNETAARRDWLSWVGWTSALFPAVKDDWTEVRNLEDLDRRLTSAVVSAGQPSKGTATVAPPGSTELFVGGFLLPGGTVGIHAANGWQFTDGKSLWTGSAEQRQGVAPCPPELAQVIRSVMLKLQKELAADIRSLANDASQLQTDRASLQRDLAEYQRLESSYGSGYEVDYGTSTMSASSAVSRTQTDIADNQREIEANTIERAKTAADLEKINLYLPGLTK